MSRLKRGAILLSLVEALKEHGSWCGETSIQKSAYFLTQALDIPFDYGFVLYKYGPYSFELTEDLTALRADEILELEVRDPRYGPCYTPGPMADYLRTRYENTYSKYSEKIEFIAKRLGGKSVAELEKLATALYVLQEYPDASDGERAECICGLKPHISTHDALAAIGEVEIILDEAAKVSL